jgi:hypothetical protein
VFPGFSGIYPKVMAYVKYDCPPEGCEEWDVVAYVNIRGANGEWVELVRYITPYALACQDSIDVTDYVSQLQGKIDISAAFPAASKVTVTLKYYEGFPAYKYSWMNKLWLGSYQFGTWTTGGVAMQPVEIRQLQLNDTTIKSAYVRVVSTGHSGPHNTGNSAEFYQATHNFKLDGVTAFTQNLWRTCNPNPAACSPQSGTWQYNRAGWCPGTIPMLWRYDISNKIGNNVNLMYEFAPGYVDLCSAFNPACVTGTTCDDCLNTENPRIMVAGEVISYYNTPPTDFNIGVQENIANNNFQLNVYPNPSNGLYNLSANQQFNAKASVYIYDVQGTLVKEFGWNGDNITIDLRGLTKGIYVMKVKNTNGFEINKLIIQ